MAHKQIPAPTHNSATECGLRTRTAPGPKSDSGPEPGNQTIGVPKRLTFEHGKHQKCDNVIRNIYLFCHSCVFNPVMLSLGSKKKIRKHRSKYPGGGDYWKQSGRPAERKIVFGNYLGRKYRNDITLIPKTMERATSLWCCCGWCCWWCCGCCRCLSQYP